MTRYLERAETTARLMEVGARNALIPNTSGGYRNEWDAVLLAAGANEAFARKYGEPVQRNIESFMFFDRENPSSIASCIEAARENGRIVRTALTSLVWDTLNNAFQELRAMERRERSDLALTEMTDWTMHTSALVRGAVLTTQLRNDGYHFQNIGWHLERADNTARLLDVKYYVLLPNIDYVGSGLDNYQWSTLLRAMSAHRAFAWAYGGAEVSPQRIAHFLILNEESPRSLLSSVRALNMHLDALERRYGKSSAAQVKARAILDELSDVTVQQIFDEGLHEFLSRFVIETGELGWLIRDVYLSGDAR